MAANGYNRSLATASAARVIDARRDQLDRLSGDLGLYVIYLLTPAVLAGLVQE